MEKNILENLNTEQKTETDYSPEEQVIKEKIENKAQGYYFLTKAIQLAEGLIDQLCKSQAIIGIAQSEAGYQKIDKLIQLTESMSDELWKSQTIAGIARSEFGHKKIDKLIQLTESIKNESYKSEAIAGIAQSKAEHGNIDQAIQFIESISYEGHKSQAIIGIARSEFGHQKIDELIQLAESMSDEPCKSRAIIGIAQSKAGHEKIDKLIQLTESMSDFYKLETIAGIAQSKAEYGNIDQAIQFIKSISYEGHKSQAIIGIARSEFGHQKIDELIQFAESMSDEPCKSQAIIGIAQSKAGHQKIDELIQFAESMSDEPCKSRAIVGIAQSKAGHQKIDELIQFAESMSDEPCKSRAIVGIARSEFGHKKIDKLIQLTESMSDELWKSQTIAGIARSEFGHKKIDKLIQLTESMSDFYKSQAIAGIAQAEAKHASKLISENKIELSLEELKEILVKGVSNKDKKLIKAIGVIANDEDFMELSKESEQDIKDLLLSDRIKAHTLEDKDNLKSITDSYIQRMKEASKDPQSGKQQIKIWSEILRDLRNNQYEDDQSIKDVLKQVATELPADNKDLPRLLKTLCEINDSNSYYLAFRLSAQKKIPKEIFSYVLKKLESKQYLPEETLKYLKPKNIDSLKRLINEYPNQFSNTIDILSKIENYGLKENEDDIFSALNDLKTLTPIIFDRYRKSQGAERRELVDKINKLKSQFFQNKPIKDILKGDDKEIINEMTYVSYKPIGMTFERVKELISKVEDKTEDLKQYIFPEDGYDFDLSKDQTYTLKTSENIDFKRISELKTLFSKEYPKGEQDRRIVRDCLLKIAKAGTELKDEETSSILSLVGDDENIRLFKEGYRNVDASNAYHFLNELYENIGIYFKDSYNNYLHKFLDENTEIFSQVKSILKQEKRQNVIKQKLGKEQSKQIELTDFEKDDGIVSILSTFISSKILQKIRLDIKKEIKKFEKTEGDKSKLEYRKKTKAYISKNVGSFFAKASAGICTAEDISLFNRKDHFHINVVEEEQFVRANIQAYIIKIEGKESLLLRGINPNTDFLKDIDIQSFCEKVFEIAEKFKTDNKLKNVYITEQGGWHALSNRQQVYDFLKKYLKEKNEKRFKFDVAKNCMIDKIYEVK